MPTSSELERVRRAKRRYDAAKNEYGAALVAAADAGHSQTVIARYAGVTKQAIQKRKTTPTEGETT